MSSNQRPRLNPPSQGSDSGILNERVLLLVFESMKWDLRVLCLAASVSRKLRAVARRLLWRELCAHRAPRMVGALANGSVNGRLGGGWHALAKLLLFCCGCESTRNFRVSHPSPGHLVKASRFSKTSGRSFLTRRCRGDLLYVSDPCEHSIGGSDDDLGIFRGVFRGFLRSRTRACLVGRQVALDERVRCPYCGARAWSMTAARLVPRSAARRLGSHDGGLEYFVCVNGHLHGSCWLVPLSSDEDNRDDHHDDLDDDEDNCDDDHHDFDDDGGGNGNEGCVDSDDDDINSEIDGSELDDQTVPDSSIRVLRNEALEMGL